MFPTSLCGVLVFDSVSCRLLRRLRLTTLSHIFDTHHTHNFVTHNFVTHHLSHTTLSHTPSFTHNFVTQLCHPPSFTHNFVTHNFVTHNFVTHHLSHTTLSHTIFHTQLCHTTLSHTTLSHTIFHTSLCHTQLCHPTSLTHNFVTHHLSRTTLSHTQLCDKQLCHTQLCHPPSFTHNFVTHNFGRRGTWRHLPSFLVAGVALGDIYLRLAWQAWHLETSTCVWRGRRGTCCTWWRAWSPLVAVGRRWSPGAPRHFAWQAWHLKTSTCVWRGRRGTWRHLPAFGVAGVALVALGGALGRRWSPGAPRLFAWQAWHLVTFTFVLRGRRGTWRHLPAFGVTGVALVRFTWQAWRLETSTCVWRGRRGTWRHLLAFGVASVALGDVYLRLAWQAWHLLHLVARLVPVGRRWSPRAPRDFAWQVWHLETSTCIWRVRRGRRGTWRHHETSTFVSCGWRGTLRPLPAFGGAGVGLGDIYLRLVWQAWHLLHLVARLVAVGRRWSPGAPRHFAWQAWHLETPTFVSRGWRGTWRHLPAFGVAGVALGDIYLRLAWQAWHLLHLVARLVAVGRRWSPLVAWGAAPLSVAGVALGDIHLRFAWQACRLETSTCVWHGRRGTCSFHVAGVALGDIHLRFAWQAWHLETSTFVSRGRWALGCLCLDPPSLTHHLSNTTFVTHHL